MQWQWVRKIPWNITQVQVVSMNGRPDIIIITMEGPRTFPVDAPRFLQLKTDAEPGSGAQWVRENLGVEPEVIIANRVRGQK